MATKTSEGGGARRKRNPSARPKAPEATVQRRAHARGNPADLQVDVYEGDFLHAGAARDISEGGVFIQGAPSAAVGDEVIVQLQPKPDAPVYVLRAEVRGVRQDGETAGVGVRFIEPEADLVAACRALVGRRKRR